MSLNRQTTLPNMHSQTCFSSFCGCGLALRLALDRGSVAFHGLHAVCIVSRKHSNGLSSSSSYLVKFAWRASHVPASLARRGSHTGIQSNGLLPLLQVIVSDAANVASPYRQDERWSFALSAATWPEVLRRYVLTRLYAQDVPQITLELAETAESLVARPWQALDPIDKLQLLAVACDEALDTHRIRSALDARMETVEQVADLFFRFSHVRFHLV
jgi:hypothetical protein